MSVIPLLLGVILLVVAAVAVLLLLAGVAFVAVTGRRGAGVIGLVSAGLGLVLGIGTLLMSRVLAILTLGGEVRPCPS